jgi:hypothetical protein
VQSEAEEDPNREPLECYHALPWLRWLINGPAAGF